MIKNKIADNKLICETEDRKVPLKYRLIPRRIKEKKLKEFYAREIKDKKTVIIETPRGKVVL